MNDYSELIGILLESEVITGEKLNDVIKIIFKDNQKIFNQLTQEEQSWVKRSAFVGLKKEVYDRVMELSKQ